MSQNTTIESTTPSSSNPSIHPVLQAALGSIDVQLEEELARYRRQRAGRPVMQPSGLGRHQIRKPLELIAVDQGAKKTQRPALGMSTAPQISFPLVMVNPSQAATSPQETSHEPMEQMGQRESSFSTVRESGEPLVAASGTNTDAWDEAEDVTDQLAPSEKPAQENGDLVPLAAAQSQPEDYLESSEKLLRSLDQEEVPPRSRKRLIDRVLTPLGVGSLLLLLLSGATLAYIFKNPSTLSALNPNRWFGSKTTTTAQKTTQPIPAKTTPSENSPTIKGPNLAAEEFPEVGLDTLSHLEPSPTQTQSVVPSQPQGTDSGATQQAPPVIPNSALPGSSSDISSALLPSPGQPETIPSTVAPIAPLPPLPTVAPRANPSNLSSVNSRPLLAPTTPVTKPNSKASSAATQQAASPASAKGNFYYVLMNYSSNRDLAQAKTIVPDAYVQSVPEGKRIYMGAFKLESQAKTLVETLKKQGINASIYHP
ncbi:SPOR domain-containing protein [Microcoleus sp. FACHB-53]|nr:SPOR domain-containing protein [Microcoleus sp. FACHB-53]